VRVDALPDGSGLSLGSATEPVSAE
jgi:hypothetical protein